MPYEHILVERAGRLTTIVINRPAAYNALHPPAHEELNHAFDVFRDDADQWVAIVTGAGEKAFCAGQDLKQQAGSTDLTFPSGGFGGLTKRFELDKPVIAAVNGVAMGGGFEIALACDIIVAAPSAKFALPEPKVGLAAIAGGIHRLPQAIGMKRAMGYMLTGRTISAAEGLSLGFINEVAEIDVVEAAKRWAVDILACSPMSLRATKQAAYQGWGHPLADALDADPSRPAVLAMVASDDCIEGPIAFSEKRAPSWKGC
jgi:crotonobetainyl-CoA hydratase